MKIIGGKKDYYDYLVSYYGYDENIVYDRRNKEPLNYKFSDGFLFHVCGIKIPVIKKNDKKESFIFSPDDPRFGNGWGDQHDREWMRREFCKPTKLNAELRQPVLCDPYRYGQKPFIPCLADFGFPTHYEAHEIYQKIYAFLGWLKDNPEPPNNQTDKDKIVAHGFDIKGSFRPKMKNQKL